MNTYALVIGINEYKSSEYDDLNAAVNDADAMNNYLRSTLAVPEENIINLRNGEATRQGILDGFRKLEEISAPPGSKSHPPSPASSPVTSPEISRAPSPDRLLNATAPLAFLAGLQATRSYAPADLEAAAVPPDLAFSPPTAHQEAVSSNPTICVTPTPGPNHEATARDPPADHSNASAALVSALSFAIPARPERRTESAVLGPPQVQLIPSSLSPPADYANAAFSSARGARINSFKSANAGTPVPPPTPTPPFLSPKCTIITPATPAPTPTVNHETLTPTPATISENLTGESVPCIIIFYAGHGARTEKPRQWKDWASDGGFVEMLCPSDISMIGTNSRGEDKATEGIPDRTVCYLLNRLSRRNGNNITLILDCCCSAGLNRGLGKSSIPRRILNPPPLSGNADPDVFHEMPTTGPIRGMRTKKGFGGTFQDSHVLLAACGRDHSAFEDQGHGLFTSALLKLLPQLDLQTTTYIDMMKRLRLPKVQTAHFDGINTDRLLFNITGSRSDPSYISCTRATAEGKEGLARSTIITLDAGDAQGIRPNDLFSIHENNLLEAGEIRNPSIGTMMASTVFTAFSTLEHPPRHRKFKVPRVCYAKRLDWGRGKPNVFCEDKSLLEFIFPEKKGEIEVVNEPAQASLVLERNGDEVYISHSDPELTQYIPARFPYTFERKSPDDIRMIIKAWQDFNYHLRRTGNSDFSQVRMELHYLQPIDKTFEWDDIDGLEASDFKPIGDNLLLKQPAEVHLTEADNINGKPMGITLYNDGNTPLYPYLFYFDPNELTIHPWFMTPQGAGQGKVDVPLRPHSSLPIGYGNGTASPWQFCFGEGRDKDIGFFKLFLSVSPINLSYLIKEESPFERLEVPSTRGDMIVGYDPEEVKELFNTECWGAKSATIIQLKTN